MAHAINGDPETACMKGFEAAQIARTTGSGRIMGELERLRSTLRPWRSHPLVVRLDHALARPA
jgi:hypothetical protein